MPASTTSAEATTTTNAAATARSAERKLLQRIILHLSIYVALLIPILVLEYGIDPFRRGFFCNDETIQYPFRKNTVSTVMLGFLVGLPPLLGIIIIEFARFYSRGRLSESVLIFRWNVRLWLLQCIKQILYFLIGLLLTLNVTEIGKFAGGRLRPHFMAVCQPQLTDGSSCTDAQNQHRYILNYVCAARGYTAADVRQARLSFPSGHTSLTIYAMLYLAIYMQQQVRWRSSRLACHFLQFVLIMAAWFTALSRVMDNWHHWSDVAAGLLIGVLCALFTARYISRVHKMPHMLASLPRQDTSTTLHEISTTPPPYTTNSDEDYRSKV